jgi:hypothetical protein
MLGWWVVGAWRDTMAAAGGRVQHARARAPRQRPNTTRTHTRAHAHAIQQPARQLLALAQLQVQFLSYKLQEKLQAEQVA